MYTGITAHLKKRIWEHKNKIIEGFSKKYNINKLVYFEQHLTPIQAIEREKNIKKWKRSWKINLIEKENPNWKDLYESI